MKSESLNVYFSNLVVLITGLLQENIARVKNKERKRNDFKRIFSNLILLIVFFNFYTWNIVLQKEFKFITPNFAQSIMKFIIHYKVECNFYSFHHFQAFQKNKYGNP